MDKTVENWGKELQKRTTGVSLVSQYQDRFIFSMAQVGKLRNLQPRNNPYFLGKQKEGEVDIPEELFAFLAVPAEIDVWYYGDASSNSIEREYAFELRFYGGSLEAPQVTVLYGLVSGIKEVIVHSNINNYVCKLPRGFSVASLVQLLTSGSLLEFVFENCKLTRLQEERLRRFGL